MDSARLKHSGITLRPRTDHPDGSPQLLFDPALDDHDLTDAYQALTRGHWKLARNLLAEASDNWDLRTHRMHILALAGYEFRTADQWRARNPSDHNAHVLYAYTLVARAFHDHGASLDQARLECLAAAETNHHDPVPLVALLTLARLVPRPQRTAISSWWQELLARDSENREAHHQYLAYWSPTWHGSHTAMTDFAHDVQANASLGSPLHMLPLVVHCEHFPSTQQQSSQQPGSRRSPAGYWRSDIRRRHVDRAFRLWWQAHHDKHAQFMVDANYLAYALSHAGRPQDAKELFLAIGPHAWLLPWAYDRVAPADVFREHRTRALASQAHPLTTSRTPAEPSATR